MLACSVDLHRFSLPKIPRDALVMLYCLNPDCPNSKNPDWTEVCLSCGTKIVSILRGRYRVIKPIAQGGFGKTYLAEDLDKLNEYCVVKQLAPNVEGTWAQNKAVELFKQEARQLQELGGHSQIPSLHAYFEDKGYLYLVQQYIDGENLGSLRRRQQRNWTEKEIGQLLLELLPVLQFIHKRNVIHRDIKPENIICRSQATSNSTARDSNKEIKSTTSNSQSSHKRSNRSSSQSSSSRTSSSSSLKNTSRRTSRPNSQSSQRRSISSSYVNPQVTSNSNQEQNKTAASKFVLIDFGVAKQLSATVMGRTGTNIGSGGYASLEQMQGGKAHPASDLFSLGATCFYLLTGVSPLRLWTEEGYSWTKNWKKYLQSPISYEMEQILHKLLQKDMEQRYQSAEEVLKEFYSKPLKPRSPLIRLTRPGQKKFVANQKNIIIAIVGISGTMLLLGIGTQLLINQNPENSQLTATDPSSNKSWRNPIASQTLTAHNDSVKSIAFSRDGKMLASGSADDTIKLWNLATNQNIATLTGNSSTVYTVAFSPDGKMLASGSIDNTIKIWDIESRQNTDTLSGHSDSIWSVAFSKDGKTLASASRDGTIKLWNLETNQEIATLNEHSKDVMVVAFSPDRKTLASGSSDNTIKLWDLQTNEMIATLEGHSDGVTSLAFNPDSSILVSSSYDNTIKFWDLFNNEEVDSLEGHSSGILSIAIAPNGRILASGSEDSTIKLWDFTTKEEIATLTGHSDPVNYVVFSPDGKKLASGSEDNTIKIWEQN